MRYWEDFAVGQTYQLGQHRVSRAEIVDFASRYDPQPLHLDERAATAGPFGGLVASGWHSAAVFMRLYADHLLAGTVSMGSPGVERLRWLVPVRPGTLLAARASVAAVQPSSRRPDRGTVFLDCVLADADAHADADAEAEDDTEDGTELLTMTVRALFGRRPVQPAPAGLPD